MQGAHAQDAWHAKDVFAKKEARQFLQRCGNERGKRNSQPIEAIQILVVAKPPNSGRFGNAGEQQQDEGHAACPQQT